MKFPTIWRRKRGVSKLVVTVESENAAELGVNGYIRYPKMFGHVGFVGNVEDTVNQDSGATSSS